MFSGFSRRQLLRLFGAFVAGTTVVGSIPFIGKLLKAQAQENEPVEQVYKGRRYEIAKNTPPAAVAARTAKVGFEQPVILTLDGKRVDVIRDTATGRYRSNLLPHDDFPSVRALVEDMINLGVVVPQSR